MRRTDASFVRLTHDRGMELLCAVERFRHKNRKIVHFRPQENEQRESSKLASAVKCPAEIQTE